MKVKNVVHKPYFLSVYIVVLPIRQRIHYKIATITYQALHLQQPSYSSWLLVNYVPSLTLRSTSQVMWPIKIFRGSNHITGTAEPKVVKFCTQVGYIYSSNRMTYSQQKGRGYGHMTVLKIKI